MSIISASLSFRYPGKESAWADETYSVLILGGSNAQLRAIETRVTSIIL
jgi:hypothetical protein